MFYLYIIDYFLCFRLGRSWINVKAVLGADTKT